MRYKSEILNKLNSLLSLNRKTLLIITLGILFLSFTASVLAQAPQNYDVTVSPVFLDLSANPGQTITEKIRIRNNTNSPLPLKISVKRLAGDEVGDLTLNEENSDQSLSWINFTNKSFVAPPLEWTDAVFTIQVPTTAAYGYYFAVTFEHDIASTVTQGASLTGASAVPILLNVRKEGAKAQAKITEFKIDNVINEYLPIDFKVQVENSGNIHIRPHGNIFITDDSGKDIAILDVNQNLANIIPETKRVFESSWTDGFLVREDVIEDGQVKLDVNGKPVKKLAINWNKLTSFRVGRYTANLLLVFDNGQRDVTLESTVSFWVIPYKAIAVILIAGIVLFFIIKKLLSIYISREVRRRQRK